VYAPGANGDVAPIRTITGSNTGLSAPQYDAVDSSGRLYVTNDGSSLGTITIYAAGANGNVAPIATIGGANRASSMPIPPESLSTATASST